MLLGKSSHLLTPGETNFRDMCLEAIFVISCVKASFCAVFGDELSG